MRVAPVLVVLMLTASACAALAGCSTEPIPPPYTQDELKDQCERHGGRWHDGTQLLRERRADGGLKELPIRGGLAKDKFDFSPVLIGGFPTFLDSYNRR